MGVSFVRKYELFLVKEEIAKHYVGRERLIYTLIADYKNADEHKSFILHKQIQYITEPINSEIERVLFLGEIHKIKNLQIEVADSILIICKKSKAKINFQPDLIKIESDGDYEAEMILFEILRKFRSYYIAIDTTKQKYGWLKPIKERKLV